MEWAKKCLAFIDKSVSSYHAIENVTDRLKEGGYSELKETDAWEVFPGGKYYVERGGASLIAFRLPEGDLKGFHLVASHCDSPSFKIKTDPEMAVEDKYLKLNTEGYGGMIYSTWLDRCLSVAGRVVCAGEGGLKCVNVNIDEDLLIIPSLAIHMERHANKGVEFNPQTDLLPLLGSSQVKGRFREKLSALSGVKEKDILGSDLFLYVREKGKIAGADGEFLVSPRLDDLECVYGSMEAMLSAAPREYCNMCVIFNNEEVGSHTREGAASTFLKDTLERVSEGLGRTRSGHLRLLADSFMISADNAHAFHPNHTGKADPVNKPVINKGIVVKHHGGQKYTTNGYTEAVMKALCQEADVPCQDYHNRSDIAGGSTLGNISSCQVAVPTVDIGLAQFAMHSAVETAGSKDVGFLIRALKGFYSK